MTETLFISDLHLHPDRPEIQSLFFEFLQSHNKQTDALYILGDLFEFWIGDDDSQSPYQDALAQLKQFSEITPCYFIQGNRDFLTGKRFEANSGCTILPDPSTIDLYGHKVLIMHGDTLCTDDIDYQAFRKKVRSTEWQDNVYAMSIDERRQYFSQLRAESQASIKQKSEEIMDVNQHAVETEMNKSDVDLLIHGHTHRPDIHHFTLNEKQATRIVLGDWYEQGSLLRFQADHSYQLTNIS